MKALIIGAAGFVGKYLTTHLKTDCGYDVSVTKLGHESFTCDENVSIYDLDILDKDSVIKLMDDLKPDCIFHLAAQSSVALSWKQPDLTCNINIIGTINILEAIRKTNINPKTLLIGSGEEYGYIKPKDIPINEKTLLSPGNIYAASKACQNSIGTIYANAYLMNLIMARSFNHIGPGQTPAFVVSDFCKQVSEIEKGKQEPVLHVGNLDAKRDFTDVRDVVRAYRLLIENGTPGETYNVGSGHAVSIRSILNQIIELSATQIEVKVDSDKFRPIDVPIIEADVSKLQNCTGWNPIHSLEKTINDTLNYWRNLNESF